MIITFSSWKGGTGKTTLCVLLAFYLAMVRLKKVLIIDLDSNCAISRVYGKELKDFTSMDLLSGTGFQDEKIFRGIYKAKDNIDIIPSHLNNMLLNNIMDRQLKNSLRKANFPCYYIKSLKRLTSDTDYTLQPLIQKRLENFVDSIIKEETNA
jgi:cellulose biosynthesis protein BcsQ